MLDLLSNLVNTETSAELLGYGLIYFAGLLWGIELIPQVIKTAKTKHVEGLSLFFFSICSMAWVSYMLGNALLGYWAIVIAHIPSLVLFLVMVCMIIKYGRKING